MSEVLIMATVACVGIVITHLLHYRIENNLQRTIDNQQATIQRLINHEPVTYKETGQTPQKPSKEIYAAWGSQMVDIDKDIQ